MHQSNLPNQGRLRADQRPLYVQAHEALHNLVHRGGYAPGERLPSEIELSEQLGISRPTLREALRLLEEEGAIVRRHGVGTFVAALQPVIEGGLEILESIERMAVRSGLTTEMQDLTVCERTCQETETAKLEMAGDEKATAVTRVIVADGQRIAYLSDLVPLAYLRETELSSSFHGSVLDLFLERAWPSLSHSRTELAAETADAELGRRLHVQRGAALLKLEAQLYAQDGRVVDYSLSYFVPGYFRFHVVRRIG